jgi:hypothetical protein
MKAIEVEQQADAELHPLTVLRERGVDAADGKDRQAVVRGQVELDDLVEGRRTPCKAGDCGTERARC